MASNNETSQEENENDDSLPNTVAARKKRPLQQAIVEVHGKENNEAEARHKDGAASSVSPADTITVASNAQQIINLCNSVKKKSRVQQFAGTTTTTIGNDHDDDIEVLSPSQLTLSTSGAQHHNNNQHPEANHKNNNHNDDENGGDDDECVVEWSNATNPNINLPHRRPQCGVYPMDTTDPQLFCAKCYCVVCDKVVTDCDDWNRHCYTKEQQQQQPEPPSKMKEVPEEDDTVIEIEEDSSPANAYHNTSTIHPFHPNPAVQSYYARHAAALMMNQRLHIKEDGDSNSEEEEEEEIWNQYIASRNSSSFDNHFTKAYNEHYYEQQQHESSHHKKEQRGRNPKDMRIPEVLAEKLMNALVLAEEASSRAYQKNNMNQDKGTSAGSGLATIHQEGSSTADDQKKSTTNNNKSATTTDFFSSQDIQRKERYERSKMEGDIPQLGLSPSFFVEGVRIGWPYPSILTPQRQMAIHLIKALKNSRHVVLESPTVRRRRIL